MPLSTIAQSQEDWTVSDDVGQNTMTLNRIKFSRCFGDHTVELEDILNVLKGHARRIMCTELTGRVATQLDQIIDTLNLPSRADLLSDTVHVRCEMYEVRASA
jgi:hypothetical protein